MTSQGPNHVRAVSIITVPGGVVSVNVRVKVDDLTVVIAKNPYSRVGCIGFGVFTRWGGGVAETCMVGIYSAISDADNDA